MEGERVKGGGRVAKEKGREKEKWFNSMERGILRKEMKGWLPSH